MKKLTILLLVYGLTSFFSGSLVAGSDRGGEIYAKWRAWYENSMEYLNSLEDLYRAAGWDVSGIQKTKKFIYDTYISESAKDESAKKNRLKISYKIFAGKGTGRQPQGTTSIAFGTSKTLLESKGGCGPPDFAQCKVDENGRLAAYYRDSCDKVGKLGPWVESGCSRASFKEYHCECCVQ